MSPSRPLSAVALVIVAACSTSEPTTLPLQPEVSRATVMAKGTRIPNPRLVLDSKLPTDNDGVAPFLYDLSVRNWADFPDALFATTSETTCNSNATVDIYDGNDNLLYGFCTLRSAADLNSIFVPVQSVPIQVYIKIIDESTGATYTSNTIRIPAP